MVIHFGVSVIQNIKATTVSPCDFDFVNDGSCHLEIVGEDFEHS